MFFGPIRLGIRSSGGRCVGRSNASFFFCGNYITPSEFRFVFTPHGDAQHWDEFRAALALLDRTRGMSRVVRHLMPAHPYGWGVEHPGYQVQAAKQPAYRLRARADVCAD